MRHECVCTLLFFAKIELINSYNSEIYVNNYGKSIFFFTDDEMDNRIKNVNRIAHKFREVAILYTQRRR